MKRKRNFSCLNTVIAVTCCFSLALLGPSAPLRVATAQDGKQSTIQTPTTELKQIYDLYRIKQTALITAASAYDREISKIQKVNSMPLTSLAEAKSIADELEKVSSTGLKKLFDKNVAVAMNNSAFKAGLEAEAARISATKLMAQIERDPASLTRISGYNSARDAVKKRVAADNLLLNQISTKLKDFSSKKGALNAAPSQDSSRTLLAKAQNHASKSRGSALSLIGACKSPVAQLNTLSLAKTASPSLEPQGVGVLEGALVAAAVLIIGAYAARRVEDITKPADPDNEADQRTRYAICVDEAYARRDTCTRRSDGLGDLLCYAVFTADLLICNGLPN